MYANGTPVHASVAGGSGDGSAPLDTSSQHGGGGGGGTSGGVTEAVWREMGFESEAEARMVLGDEMFGGQVRSRHAAARELIRNGAKHGARCMREGHLDAACCHAHTACDSQLRSPSACP